MMLLSFQRAESLLGRYLIISADHLVKLIVHHPVEVALSHASPVEQVVEDLVVKVGSEYMYYFSLVVRKPVFGVSDQVRHKPGCTATEDGWKLEISQLGSRGIVLYV